jgi:hypothetical protein
MNTEEEAGKVDTIISESQPRLMIVSDRPMPPYVAEKIRTVLATNPQAIFIEPGLTVFQLVEGRWQEIKSAANAPVKSCSYPVISEEVAPALAKAIGLPLEGLRALQVTLHVGQAVQVNAWYQADLESMTAISTILQSFEIHPREVRNEPGQPIPVEDPLATLAPVEALAKINPEIIDRLDWNGRLVEASLYDVPQGPFHGRLLTLFPEDIQAVYVWGDLQIDPSLKVFRITGDFECDREIANRLFGHDGAPTPLLVFAIQGYALEIIARRVFSNQIGTATVTCHFESKGPVGRFVKAPLTERAE